MSGELLSKKICRLSENYRILSSRFIPVRHIEERNDFLKKTMIGKKRMLGTILIVVGAIIVVLLAVIAMQSPDYRIERKILVSAPVEVVFAQVNDFHKWD